MTSRRWYAGRHVVVGGTGVTGAAVTRALQSFGARVTVFDRVDSPALAALAETGADVLVDPAELPGDLEQIVVSPGFRPDHPLLAGPIAAGIEVFSEPELAWRLRPGPRPTPWLTVTGTNGKTTTVTMLATILRSAGLRTTAVGNIGVPLIDAVLDPEPYDVLAVELSSYQLHWSSTLAPAAAALLNLADDHLSWHGDFASYAEAKAKLWYSPETVAIGNVSDSRVAELLAAAPGRRVGFSLHTPAPGQFGVVEDLLVDRAFTDDPAQATAVGTLGEVRPPGPHNVANALAAAALARSHGVEPDAVAAGLAAYEPEPHRNALVRVTRGGVTWVDDSKATNPHAAEASLRAYPRVVWVAGGELKGVDIGPLVASVADRLVGAVLLGVDRAEVAEALRRHAPHVPVREVSRADDGAMTEVVAAAAELAHPGDTILLAPAAASRDMFPSYAARGHAFADAVEKLAAASPLDR
ncbi:UDP-N-acetylmuramoyl-L-alanine--D-glutamate ligase [Cryptosporangium aurantiacum]|uniref:UDP-N-acetylmuramoylalanine--D-glutamate ligase n=1 Tax=Cryptosporangium aurantiacum TaxID=134849 RepID=A0A1M7I4K7_9ACTN|nr:UDP-N-acetylmuramoyl-L-alanine--D-glutamate ligase [Cryptosporangium aurantiacum]SHM35722.1 UDP-N-acetylmuramoylalanine--D-glutamate ligase [Cryptosporangium aurantiacum]